METPARPERITMKTIWYAVLDWLNVERGLIYTLVALTKHPGQTLRTYLAEDRTRLVPPFRFLILSVAVGTFITIQYFKNGEWARQFQESLKKGYGQSGDSDPEFFQAYSNSVQDIFNNYFNLFILAGVPILALSTFWFFRKNMNYAEHLMINSYLTAYTTIIYIVLTPLLWVTDYQTMNLCYFVGSLTYSAYMYIQVFEQKIWRGIVRTLLVNVVYVAIYYALFIGFFMVFALFLIISKK